MKPVPVIEIRMWGTKMGAVALDPALRVHASAYDPKWKRKGIEAAPLGSIQTIGLSQRQANSFWC